MDRDELISGTIFDIQGFSVHDGPGCRTLVFLKGCTLRCEWCSNPEGISPDPEPLWNDQKCTRDLDCLESCPHKAISFDNNALNFDRHLCRECREYSCADACFASALRIAGRRMNVDEVFKRVSRDRHYWGAEGGITLTGGEPFFQEKFTTTLLKKCFEANIHTAVETCGNVQWAKIKSALPYLDWIFYDLKSLNPVKYGQVTGVCKGTDSQADRAIQEKTLETILSNARKLAAEFTGRLIFRIPLVPGFNDDGESIAATIGFLHHAGISEINILPVHHFGREKYRLLGQIYKLPQDALIEKQDLDEIKNQFEAAGIACYTGAGTPF